MSRFVERTPGIELDATTRALITRLNVLADLPDHDAYDQAEVDLANRILAWPTPMRREAIAQAVDAQLAQAFDREGRASRVLGWDGPYSGCHCGCEPPRPLVCVAWLPQIGCRAFIPSGIDELLLEVGR